MNNTNVIGRSKTEIRRLVMAAVLLSLCVVLPFFIGRIPDIGMRLSPMHIPVLIAGFACGWKYGVVIGFIAPLLNSLIFQSPPMISPFPMAPAMAFELAAYGALSGILYKLLPKKILYIYPTLIISMIVGRVVWGVAMFVFAQTGIMTAGPIFPFTLNIFWTWAFANGIPGIILHIVMIPPVIIALKKAGYLLNK